MQSKTQKMALVSMFAVLTIIGAKIAIPIPQVSFTLQVFFVILSGLILGSKLGFLSQFIYIAIGLTGIPIFSTGGGISYIFKPSFGYIIGFAVAAFVAGKIKELWGSKKPTYFKLFASSFIGLVSCYVFGVTYLILYTNVLQGANSNVQGILISGFLAFIPLDLIKLAAASWVAKEVLNRMQYFSLRYDS